MFGHSFKRIYMKFGVWHPYAIQMVTGLASAAQARAFTLSSPSIRSCKSLASTIGKFRTSGRQRNGSSAVGASCDRSL